MTASATLENYTTLTDVTVARLDSSAYGTHSLRRTEAARVYRKTGNLKCGSVASWT